MPMPGAPPMPREHSADRACDRQLGAVFKNKHIHGQMGRLQLTCTNIYIHTYTYIYIDVNIDMHIHMYVCM